MHKTESTLKTETQVYSALKNKIESRELKVGVIGLGYVGLPLACEMASSGVQVMGFDVDQNKIRKIESGKSYIIDIDHNVVGALVKKNKLAATADFSFLAQLDAIHVCVPTPLRKTKDPDMSYVEEAVKQIKSFLRKGQLIVLESTTYPGTTEEHVLPELESTGLTVGQDFFLAFSPERVDPGNKIYHTKNTPKVVGGVTKACTKLAAKIYELSLETVVQVSSPRSAEMVKLLENTFRSVNIGMANEMVLMCDKLGVDVWEVIDAAATKPFGFMPFYPGPGLGGHCIPIDPLYLSWKLKALNYDAKFIGLAGEINRQMPEYVVKKIQDQLNIHRKAINGASILIIGVAYKADIDDVRESPALDILLLLKEMGANIKYHDAHISELKLRDETFTSVELDETLLEDSDCTVLVTNHSYLDINWLVEKSKLFLDTRNASKGIDSPNICKL